MVPVLRKRAYTLVGTRIETPFGSSFLFEVSVRILESLFRCSEFWVLYWTMLGEGFILVAHLVILLE